MKNITKILALALAALLLLAAGSVALAAEKITIQSTADSAATDTNGTTYDWYEILKAEYTTTLTDVDPDTGALIGDPASPVSYYVENETLANLLAATGVFTVKTSDSITPTRYYVTLTDSTTTGEAIAAALNTDAIKAAAIANGRATANGTSDVVIEVPEKGYYLIVASNGTKLAVQTLGDVTIKEKNTYPTIDKNVTGENGTDVTAAKTNDVNIGDTITYTVTVDVPATVAEKDMTITDTIGAGLTLDKSSLTVTYPGESGDATITTSFTGDASPYTVVIPAADVKAAAGKTITLTYSATLNANAVINGEGNTNSVKLAYDAYETVATTTATTTHKFEVKKTDPDGNALDGVSFTLQRDDNKYYVTKNGDASVWQTEENTFTTAGGANLVFEGLDAGTYTLTETATVSGYNMMNAPVVVTIAEDGAVTYTCADTSTTGNTKAEATPAEGENYVITILNQSGVQLPSTGGIGTTIFYVVGGVLVAAAAVLLITKRRMSSTKD